MFVNIATEDELSEAIAVRLVSAACGHDRIGLKLGRRGNGYLKTKMPAFRSMAAREPVLVLTDLDDLQCPVTLIDEWKAQQEIPEDLLLRVAVREAEAWLLADRQGTAELLGVSAALIPANPEEIDDPKRFILQLARRAKRDVRSELIVAKGAVASQGLGYNRVLSAFAGGNWNLLEACNRSASLARASARIDELAARLPPY